MPSRLVRNTEPSVNPSSFTALFTVSRMALMRFAVLTSPLACVIGMKFVIHEPGFIAIMFAATLPSTFFATLYIWRPIISSQPRSARAFLPARLLIYSCRLET